MDLLYVAGFETIIPSHPAELTYSFEFKIKSFVLNISLYFML
jgi:hypothetical protein